MTVTAASDIPTLSLLYKLNKLVPAPQGSKLPKTLTGPSARPAPSKELNDRVAVIRADITTLAVDAIVNAANRSLLGGGGVDGVIHRVAGSGLLEECRKLNGCETGSAKITDGYKLPCQKVIHAVGPVYDVLQPEQSEMLLAGCYSKGLELAAANNCPTIAFSAISTGVYGYPSREAAPVAIGVVRKFLEQDTAGRIRKVVFVTFEPKDVDAYNEFLPYAKPIHIFICPDTNFGWDASLYFPPPSEDVSPSKGSAVPAGSNTQASDGETEAKSEAEAKAIAEELPSAPTADPSDSQHVDKKQKHDT